MDSSALSPARMTDLLRDALAAGGFTDRSAVAIATHLVDAEMKGVASHGTNRLGLYLREARDGVIDPKVEPAVTEAKPGIMHVDGMGGHGITAMTRATEVLIETASGRGMAAVGVVKCGHTGRMGAYVEQAAEAGLFATCFGGGGRRLWGNVVPFGGLDPMMSTNPYTIGAPGRPGDPVVCDFAISTLPAGKVAVARVNSQHLPEGAIIDKTGQPSTNPEDFYDGGALLPAAGPKGSGLGIIAELMGDAMLGDATEYNWTMIALKVDAFRPMADYAAAASGFMDEVRGSRPAPGFDKVMLPGERETRLAEAAAEAGLNIEAGVWNGIVEAASGVGIDAESYFSG